MFKEIVTASLSIPFIKAGDDILIWYILANKDEEIFSFFPLSFSRFS